jgi:two-component system sensor histidine kinase HydH
MAESLLEELKRYVGFGPDDESALRELRNVAAPDFPAIAVAFYDRILAHEEARRALAGGESQVGHLRATLVRWMEEAVGGPWDESWWEAHCRIGRVHVRIDLPQHYMFGAMNVVREEL